MIATLAQTELPIYVERNGNANEIPTSSVFCGRIESGEDYDSVVTHASKDDWLVIHFLPCDNPFVGVIDVLKDGNPVAGHHFGSDPNGQLRHRIGENGAYEIRIRDAIGRSG